MGPANTPSSTSLNTALRLPPLSLPHLQIGPAPGQTTTSSSTRVQEELYLRQRVISILTQALDIVEDRDV